MTTAGNEAGPGPRKVASRGARPLPSARLAWAAGLTVLMVAGCGRGEKAEKPSAGDAPSGLARIIQVGIVPNPASATSILTAQARAADRRGSPAEMRYQWMRNGEEIPGATTQRLHPSAFQRGDAISVRVTPQAEGMRGAEVTSAPVSIQNSPPIIVRLAVTPSSPAREDTLKVAVEARDPDEDPLTFTYQWLRNGIPIPEATGPTLASPDLRKGDRISVRVRASDGEAQSAPAESPTLIIRNTPPRVVAASEWRSGTEGEILYQVKAADADGDPLAFRLSSDAPKGMSIDSKTGVLRWAPGPTDAGTHRFAIIIDDGDGGTVQQEITTVVGAR